MPGLKRISVAMTCRFMHLPLPARRDAARRFLPSLTARAAGGFTRKVGAHGTVSLPNACSGFRCRRTSRRAVKRRGRNQKSVLMKQLRYKVVEQKTLSSP
jgi:hypothetical protein